MYNTFRNSVKNYIRNILSIRNDETISDGISRIYYHYKKKLPYKKLNSNQLKDTLNTIGVKEGDVLIVHASWRAMYMLDMQPIDVIHVILDVIGKSGTLVMPCYGKNENFFSCENTRSAAGVLSETLRLKSGSIRSCFPKFSMIAYGNDAKQIVKTHISSIYQFDYLSPYSIATKSYNAKILLIGLGKYPHKITVFHCASYDYKDKSDFYSECYSNLKEAYVECKGVLKKITYLDRMNKFQNNKSIFIKLFKKIKKSHININNLDFILFSAIDGYNEAYRYCQSGGKIYKILK